jgi:hypothetical protein
MSLNNGYLCLILGSFVLSALPKSQAFYVSSDPNSLVLEARGAHEEITRQAWLQVNSTLAFDNGVLKTLTQGNYATDVPGGFYPLSLPAFWQYPKNIFKWHNNPIGQHLHSLRNRVDANSLESALSGCAGLKQEILIVLKSAYTRWLAQDDKSESWFLIGHSIHMLQDSFSPAHSVRNQAGNFNLVDVCYYGPTDDSRKGQICHHEEADARDHIWLVNSNVKAITLAKGLWESKGEQVNSVNSIEDIEITEEATPYVHSLFTHEARLAQVATSKYLYTVGNFFKTLPLSVATDAGFAELERRVMLVFDSAGEIFQDTMSEGVLNCSELTK